jgi:hypothetical protein
VKLPDSVCLCERKSFLRHGPGILWLLMGLCTCLNVADVIDLHVPRDLYAHLFVYASACACTCV